MTSPPFNLPANTKPACDDNAQADLGEARIWPRKLFVAAMEFFSRRKSGIWFATCGRMKDGFSRAHEGLAHRN
ncbi:hypothetical protein OLX02_18815 [Novosphingobium sp. KCTC 2891]|uniref:hypothetical protein n=1 Tax=Novosphingobium sp. KCTC 2891 TaxID=2989730 RepID=UPI002221FFA1|nr:hypothetical protein [Novosphingobium sp. KCTC 2891]MCW1384871.1 hypothetical protein [Novosphingobium sp. KCTC 2891]